MERRLNMLAYIGCGAVPINLLHLLVTSVYVYVRVGICITWYMWSFICLTQLIKAKNLLDTALLLPLQSSMLIIFEHTHFQGYPFFSFFMCAFFPLYSSRLSSHLSVLVRSIKKFFRLTALPSLSSLPILLVLYSAIQYNISRKKVYHS